MRTAAGDVEVVTRLARGLAGEVAPGEERLGRDFGGVVRGLPAAVVRSRGEEDAAHCFRVAAEVGVVVGFRGAGRSGHGQSLNEDGILVEKVWADPRASLASGW